MTKSLFSAKHDRFRELITQARKNAGLTQEDLSKKLRRPQSFVSKYEIGERRLDILEFSELVKYLDIEPTSFFKELNK